MKTATAPLPPLRSVKVLDQLRERIRYLHYSLPTEQAYVHWVRAFIRFHGVRHPATLGSSEVEAFLSWLANERKVSVSTHRQALAALLFFYGKVLCTDLPWQGINEDQNLLCVECEAPIPPARRRAIPGVQLCITCQEIAELKGKHYNGGAV